MKEAIIGTLFIASLAVILYFSFILGGEGSLSQLVSADLKPIRLRFDQVTGLKIKSDVLVSGIRKGAVTGFTLEQDGSVIVHASIEADSTLFNDAGAEMINVSALGGKAVSIDPGSARAGMLQPETIIEGVFIPDFLTSAGKAMGKVESGIDHFTKILQDVDQIVGDVKAGQGPIGMMLRDRETAEGMRRMVENLGEATKSMRRIGGELDQMLAQINSGKGLVSRALYEDKIANDFASTFENARAVVEEARILVADVKRILSKVDNGEGIVSTLLNDVEFREDIRSALRQATAAVKEVSDTFVDVKEVVKGLRRGDGSLGKFLTDETFYNDALRTLNTLQAGFEDLREQAPVTTFATVIFQAFQ